MTTSSYSDTELQQAYNDLKSGYPLLMKFMHKANHWATLNMLEMISLSSSSTPFVEQRALLVQFSESLDASPDEPSAQHQADQSVPDGPGIEYLIYHAEQLGWFVEWVRKSNNLRHNTAATDQATPKTIIPEENIPDIGMLEGIVKLTSLRRANRQRYLEFMRQQ